MKIYWIVIVCWGIFFSVWFVGAIYNYYKTLVSKKSSNFNFQDIWRLALIIGLGVAVKYVPHHYWALITYNAQWLKWLGVILLICSTIFTIWSRIVLGRMWAIGTEVKEKHKLRIEGPYKITRHPIYTGVLGMILGSTFINGFGWVLLLFIGVFVLFKLKINSEEKFLIETFKQEYQDFKRNTPELFPRLYR